MEELSTTIKDDALPGLSPEYRNKLLSSLRGLYKRLIRWRLLDRWGPYWKRNWIDGGKRLPFYFESIGEDQCNWVDQTDTAFNYVDQDLIYCFWTLSTEKMGLGWLPSDRTLVGAVNRGVDHLLNYVTKYVEQAKGNPRVLHLHPEGSGEHLPSFNLEVEDSGRVWLTLSLEVAVGLPKPPGAVVLDWDKEREAIAKEMKENHQ